LASSNNYIWTNVNSIDSILEGYKVKKKLIASLVLLATAIFSGAFVYNTLKKAGLEGIFDFDLDEEIDNEDF
jgi:hypothetical protein